MAKKVILGGIVAGVVMFVWGAVSHMILQLGDAGLSQLSDEEPVLAAIRAHVKEPGLYFYPGLPSEHPTPEQQKEWEGKYRAGPAGLLLTVPTGGEAMPPSKLLIQLLTDVAIALLVGVLLVQANGWMSSFGSRVLFATLVGFTPFLAVNLPYWNWYGFPTVFTLAQMADRVIGFVLIGLVLAFFVKPYAPQGRGLQEAVAQAA